jgi:methylthioribose-1-phosphate isomerase
VRAVAEGAPVANGAFDVTPLVSGLITERGVLQAGRGALASAFPERVRGG